MTTRPNGKSYVGTTTDLARRAWEHREGVADGFTKRYGLTRLVYAEWHDDTLSAKQREMNLKHWSRAWMRHSAGSRSGLDATLSTDRVSA